MKAAIFYATREGQGQRVAQHIAEILRALRFDVVVRNVKDSPESIDLQPDADDRRLCAGNRMASRVRAAGGECAHLQQVQPLLQADDEDDRQEAGAATDTSRDYEFTEWAALDRFVLERVDVARAR